MSYSTAITSLAGVRTLASMFLGPQWGIFSTTGTPLLISDSVKAIEARGEWEISDCPVEAPGFGNTGNFSTSGFASYNKVARPFEGRISFLNGGQKSIDGFGGILTSLIPGLGLIDLASSLLGGLSLQGARRQQFMQRVLAMADSVTLFTIVTPEFSMPAGSITHVEFHRDRESGGASLIPIDVWVREVRPVASRTLTNTAAPSGQDPIANGSVQPTTPSASQEQAAAMSGAGAADLTGGSGIA
jgi:hypothetical protein